eukprot:9358829-Heterocapsa_arctica.AAC.1
MQYIVCHYKRFETSAGHGRRRHIWVREATDEDQVDSESNADLDDAIGRAQQWQQQHGRGPGQQRQKSDMDAGTRSFLLDVAEFLTIFNGPWWGKGFVHYCAGVHYCRSPAHTAERMTNSLRRLRVKSGAADVDMDMQLTLDCDLSAVTGARYRAAQKFLLDEATCWSLTVMGLVLEPV